MRISAEFIVNGTKVLPAGSAEGKGSAGELLPLVYKELRKLAAARMVNESRTSTLQPTALVHEAWLRLVSSGEVTWENCGQFSAAAAEAMRRILIDRARRKYALKRGKGAQHLDFDRLDVAAIADEESLLAVDEALEKLAVANPQSADLIKLRFFTGLNYQQAAQALGISPRTAKRLWTFGRAWLYRELSKP